LASNEENKGQLEGTTLARGGWHRGENAGSLHVLELIEGGRKERGKKAEIVLEVR